MRRVQTERMDRHVRRILIVEDEPQIRGLLKAHLEIKMPTVEVEGAGSAEEGLDRLRSQDFDLILSDYHLPRMDGVEFLRQSQRTHPMAHRVLMTGAPEENLAPTAAREAGIDRFFVKPLDVKALARTLEGMLPKQE
jgi:DNA-binding response OmpR family regulator